MSANNSNVVSGNVLAYAGDMYICIGFIPDWVEIWSLGHSDEVYARWSVNNRLLLATGGFTLNDDGDVSPEAMGTVPAVDTGIQIYRGGTIISATSTPSTTTCYVKDPTPDARGDGAGADIDTWTLGSSANRTGNWNDVCSTSTVGIGSRICIDGRWATVVALTGNGEAANEVTLNEALGSGRIDMLTSMYDYYAAAAGTIAPAGFWIDSGSDIVDQAVQFYFEAGCYR